MPSKPSRILCYDRPMDWSELMKTIEILSENYPFLTTTELGKSILGRSIPCLTLGNGRRSVLYVGAHHGMEWITSILLLRFVNELCQAIEDQKKICKISLKLLLEQYTLIVIPMLNPDGVEYQIHGVEESNPLFVRALSMNGGNSDFSRWQANARGVDLNHNYNAGFREYKQLEAEQSIPCGAPTRYSGQEPESEPEVRALCDYIRFQKELRLVLTLHTQGEEIFYKSRGAFVSGTYPAISKIAELTGYSLSVADGLAAYGGLTDWCLQKLGIPALTLECGKGVNPLPLSDYGTIYSRLREGLFLAPTLF